MRKRIVPCLLVMIFLCSALFACGEKEEETKVEETVCVSIMVDTKKEFPLWEYIQKQSGMEITLDVVPNEEICHTLLLRQAGQALPDLVYLKSRADMQELVRNDLLIDLSEHREAIDEYEKALFGSEEPEETERMARAEDGGLYLLPSLGISRAGTERGWLYRADVFQRVGLTIPDTMQELAQAALALKKAFPNSTPLALRDGFYGLDLLAPAWKNDASIGIYYDFQEEEWRYGATESWMGNFVSYWASMVRSGLIPQNFLSMDSAAVDALIAQNRVFIIPDSVWRLETYKEKYPDQDWRLMPAPKAATEGAQHKIAKRESAIEGYAVCNVGDEASLSSALAFLNWMYSKQAEQVLSWGLEGESYRVEQAEKKLLLSGNESASTRYGFGTDGLQTQCAPEAQKYTTPENRIQSAYLASVYTERFVNPARYLLFTQEEEQKIFGMQQQLNQIMETALSEFLTGVRPMTQWADFAESLEDTDLEAILDVYQRAYERIDK